MSIESIAAVLHHSLASGTDKLVLVGIANHDGDGGAWPSLDTLAKYAGVSRTRVKTSIKRLVELGEVAVHVQKGGMADHRNDRRPNRYDVLVSCPADCDGTTKHRTGVRRVTPVAEPTGVRIERTGVRNEAHGGQTGDHEPSITNYPAPTDLRVARVERDARELEMRSVVEAIRQTVPDAASWLGKKALPALERGWLPYDIAKAVVSEPFSNARSVSAILGARLDDLGTRSPIRPVLRPTWCGKCDERTRFIEVGDKVARCSDCHPMSIGRAAV